MKKQLLFLAAFLFISFQLLAQMVLEYNTNLSEGTTIALPLDGDVNVTVDWGDGISEIVTVAGVKTHTYATHGIYTVSISGFLSHFGSKANYAVYGKLIKVISFGNLGIISLSRAFAYASNLKEVPAQIPSTVTDISYMFLGALSFNQNINNWNVSKVINMEFMFGNATSFNQDISNWNVSKVTNMRYMFNNAISFNQDINSWNVSNVTNMSGMFADSTSFNQNIGLWDVSKVIDMSLMFSGADYFNQDISPWDVSKVTSMYGMFSGATSFNKNISSWDVSNVTNMSSMFADAISFNQDLSSWNVSKVTDMSYMFYYAESFNQDLSSWDVSKVTDMSRMFVDATSFNQDISNWNVSNIANMYHMFEGVKLSTANYNALLNSWSKQLLNSDVNFHGGYSKYSYGVTAADRQSMIDTYGWTITDGGTSNLPAIATNEVVINSLTTATSGGGVSEDGGENVTARGIVWDTIQNPSLDTYLGKTLNGTGLGSFSNQMTNLSPLTTYYVRAYATNANGTDYGQSICFYIANLPDTIIPNFVKSVMDSAFVINAPTLDTCIVDPFIAVDIVKITDISMQNNSLALVEWSFWQNGVQKTFTNEVDITNDGWNVIYQPITCSGKKKSDNTITLVGAYNIVITAINEVPQSKITISPNPATDNITISLHNTETVHHIDIVNLMGQVVYTKQVAHSTTSEQIDISTLQNGVYLVKMNTTNGIVVKKLIVE